MEFRSRRSSSRKLEEKDKRKNHEDFEKVNEFDISEEKWTKGKKKKSQVIPRLKAEISSLKTNSQKSQLHWQSQNVPSPSNPSLSLTSEGSDDGIQKRGRNHMQKTHEIHLPKTHENHMTRIYENQVPKTHENQVPKTQENQVPKIEVNEQKFDKLDNLLDYLDDESESITKKENVPTSEGSQSHRITDPSNQSKTPTQKDTQYVLENTVRQISEIWIRASDEVIDSLKNLPQAATAAVKDDSLMKIDLAIKQAKSLSLIKTKEALAEAKKLIENREIIRKELEKLMNFESDKSNKTPKQRSDSSRDSQSKGIDENSSEKERTTNFTENVEPKEIDEENSERASNGTGDSNITTDNMKKDIIQSSGEPQESSEPTSSSRKQSSDSEACECLAEVKNYWEVEIKKKNETISHLNSKIFEIQKICHKNTIKFSQLQSKIEENQEKIKLDHVLWKQVEKLKKEVRDLKEANKQLEERNSELNLELQRQIKLNQRLSLGNSLTNDSKDIDSVDYDKPSSKSESLSSSREKSGYSEKQRILAEKQNVIEHLKTVLNIMKDQENSAQKQIELFQSKIQELQNSTLT